MINLLELIAGTSSMSDCADEPCGLKPLTEAPLKLTGRDETYSEVLEEMFEQRVEGRWSDWLVRLRLSKGLYVAVGPSAHETGRCVGC